VLCIACEGVQEVDGLRKEIRFEKCFAKIHYCKSPLSTNIINPAIINEILKISKKVMK